MGGIDWAAYEYRCRPTLNNYWNNWSLKQSLKKCQNAVMFFSVLDLNRVFWTIRWYEITRRRNRSHILWKQNCMNSWSCVTLKVFTGCPAKCSADGNWRLGGGEESNQPMLIDRESSCETPDSTCHIFFVLMCGQCPLGIHTGTCSNKFLLYSDPCSVSPYKLWNWIDSYHLVLEFMTSLMTPTYHTSFRDLIRPLSQHHHEVLLRPTRRSIRSTCSTVSVYDVLFLE